MVMWISLPASSAFASPKRSAIATAFCAGAKSSGNRTSFRRSKGGAGGKRNPHNHASKISLDFFSELGQERALPLERESNAPILCGLGHRQGDGTRRAVVAPFVDDFITDANFFGRSRGAVQRHFRTLPPRLKRILLDAALHRYGAIRNLTRIVDAQNLTFLVGEGVSVVLIERTPAITARRSGGKIDAQFERPVRLLTGVLHNRLHGHNGAGANIERHFIHTRMQVNFVFVGVLLRVSIVVPFSGRQENSVGVGSFRHYGRHK